MVNVCSLGDNHYRNANVSRKTSLLVSLLILKTLYAKLYVRVELGE